MQETSALYKSILESQNHWFESSLDIGEFGRLITESNETITFGGTRINVQSSGGDGGYRENMLISISTSQGMFSEDTPTVGCCISGEIDVQIYKPTSDITRMAMLVPYVRVTDGVRTSEWIKKGVFYTDTKEVTANDNGIEIVQIHGYDAMLKSEINYPSDTKSEYPKLDTEIMEIIANAMGVEIDPRTYDIMTDGYRYGLPAGYSCREMLGYIASSYGGSFIITDEGELRLITIWELPKETRLLIDTYGNKITFGKDTITGEEVRILV